MHATHVGGELVERRASILFALLTPWSRMTESIRAAGSRWSVPGC